LQQLGDALLRLRGKQPILDDTDTPADPIAIHIVISGDQQQMAPGQGLGPVLIQHRPQGFQPSPGRRILSRLPGLGQVAGDDHQVRVEPGFDLRGDETPQGAQDRVRVPRRASVAMEVGQVQEANRLGHGGVRRSGAESSALGRNEAYPPATRHGNRSSVAKAARLQHPVRRGRPTTARLPAANPLDGP